MLSIYIISQIEKSYFKKESVSLTFGEKNYYYRGKNYILTG